MSAGLHGPEYAIDALLCAGHSRVLTEKVC